MDKSTVLREHIEFKKTSVSSKAKLQDIERYLSKFLNSSKKPLDKFTEEDVAKFINSLKYSTRSINDIKVYLKVFLRWHYADWSSRFRNLEKLCKQQKPSKAYQPEQMLSIKDIEKLANGEKDLMYKVYWLVLFYGGFRPSECCELKWSEVYFEPEGVIIKLHASKTGKDFYKSLPENVEHILKQWKEHNSSAFVFPSPVNENDTLRARSVCAKLKRLSKRVLGKEVVPYQLRHSIATILYKDDLRKDDDSANQMGHSKSMKQVYMNLDEQTIKTKARKLWIKTELPLEKKAELERQIEEMSQRMKLLEKEKEELPNKIMEMFLQKYEQASKKKLRNLS